MIFGWTFGETFTLVHGLVVVAALVTVPSVLRGRSPASTFAWLLVLTFVPAVGVVMFLLFGRDRIRYSVKRKRAGDEIMRHALGDEWRAAPAPLLTGAAYDLFSVASRLARAEVTEGNALTLTSGGEASYDALWRAIDGAEHHIHAQFYLIRPDETGREFFARLIQARRRGVEVRVLCDGVGGFVLPRRAVRALVHAGGRFAFFLPLSQAPFQPINLRNHRKIVVIDGKLGFTGGINIGDEYRFARPGAAAWRDAHLGLRGPVVRDLQKIFLRDWFFATREKVSRPEFFACDAAAGQAAAAVLPSGPDSTVQAIARTFVAAINGARRRVLITTPYFVPDEALLVALQLAALRGVEVRLIMPSRSNHKVTFHAGRSFYEFLLAAGVHIHEYLPGMLHAKTMLVDGELALVGSANMDLRSFRLNFEVHVVGKDTALAAALEAACAHDLAHSQEIDPARWAARPEWAKLAEGSARLVSPLL